MILDRQTICRKSSHIGGRQDEMCRNEPEIVDEVSNGVQLAIEECQIQFEDRRWNCTSKKTSMSNLFRKRIGNYYYHYSITLVSAVAFHLLLHSCGLANRWIALLEFVGQIASENYRPIFITFNNYSLNGIETKLGPGLGLVDS